MKVMFRLLLVFMALAQGCAWARPPRIVVPPVAQIATSDGPHVLWKGSEATLYQVRDGRASQKVVQGAFDLLLPGITGQPVSLTPEPQKVVCFAHEKPAKILAVSDVHGRFDSLLHLLQAQHVVDAELHWRFGQGQLVIVGDVMDRGPQVTESYWFLRGLEQAAKKSGGAVHVILGNHEAMLLAGDTRYVNSKYLAAPTGLPALSVLYGPTSELGRWLRTRPAMVRLGDILFVHGGISPEVLELGLDLHQINLGIANALGLSPKEAWGDAAVLLSSKGPLWYRGLLPEGGSPQATEDHITRVLDHFKVRTLVVGHTTLPALGGFHGGRVYGIDAGIKDGNPGEAWLWAGGKAWRASADGGRVLLVP